MSPERWTRKILRRNTVMAGSWNHTVEGTYDGPKPKSGGKLLSNTDLVGMLENGGDVYEYAEEAYGMVWWLATVFAKAVGGPMTPEVAIEEARLNYLKGIEWSPGVAEDGALEDDDEPDTPKVVVETYQEGDWVVIPTVMSRVRVGRVRKRQYRSSFTYVVEIWWEDKGRFTFGTHVFHRDLIRRATVAELIRHNVPASLR